MKQKFQEGDVVRFKKGMFKGQLADVKRVFKTPDRYKYGVTIHNTHRWVVGWSFDFDKAVRPITAKDLKRYGFIPKYERNAGPITSQRFHYQPSNGKKSKKIVGYLDIRLFTKRNEQKEIVESECSIWLDRHLCADQSCNEELIKWLHLCVRIFNTQELKKVMNFIQNI